MGKYTEENLDNLWNDYKVTHNPELAKKIAWLECWLDKDVFTEEKKMLLA